MRDKHDLSAWHTPADADQYMLHAAASDRTHVQLLLNAEPQKCQNVERVITDL